MNYLIAIVVDGDPRKTRVVAMKGLSEWQVAWLYELLNPGAWVVAVRAVA